MLYVQLANGAVITEYSCPQDAADKPGYSEIAEDSPEAVAWKSSQNVASTISSAFASGCQIISTGTPAISGTYAIDTAAIADVMAECQFIAAFAEFSNLTSTMVWPIREGSVTFPSTAAAMSIFKAIAQYVTAWKQYAAGIIQTPPASPVTIP